MNELKKWEKRLGVGMVFVGSPLVINGAIWYLNTGELFISPVFLGVIGVGMVAVGSLLWIDGSRGVSLVSASKQNNELCGENLTVVRCEDRDKFLPKQTWLQCGSVGVEDTCLYNQVQALREAGYCIIQNGGGGCKCGKPRINND